MKIRVDKLCDAVAMELESYSKTINQGVQREVQAAGQLATKRLRRASPRASGDYKKGWAKSVTAKNASGINVSVHQKSRRAGGKPGLTHLLEHGHRLLSASHRRIGKGAVAAIPHIAPVEEQVELELTRKLEELIKQ